MTLSDCADVVNCTELALHEDENEHLCLCEIGVTSDVT